MNYWEKICEIEKRQTEKGIKTYGQTLEENNIFDIESRIEYFEEELVDALKYSEWIKDKLEIELNMRYELGKTAERNRIYNIIRRFIEREADSTACEECYAMLLEKIMDGGFNG